MRKLNLLKKKNTGSEETQIDDNNSNKGEINDAVDPTIKPKKDYTQLYPDMYVKRPEKQISPNKTIFLTLDETDHQPEPEKFLIF